MPDLRARALSLWISWIVCLFASPAAAAPLLYLVAADDAELRVVDAADASTTSSVTMTLAGETIQGANGLARDPNGGQLYALLKLQGQSNRELVQVDPISGVATSIGDTGKKMAGLAFDAAGTLYGVVGDQAFSANPQDPETLFTISLSDATPTFFQTLGNGDDGETIAYRPDDGLLYHASGTHVDQVFESVDLGSGLVSDIPLSGDPYTEAGALVWAGGGFYLADRTDDDVIGGHLYALSASGDVSVIGELDVFQPKGMVLVPEPASAVLLAVGLVALAARRRA